ncbi:MAG: hypothetical protein KJ770_03640 [Actinobacteria bacterium]|nr:hypothetical protein [Actinomycetota bacterium]
MKVILDLLVAESQKNLLLKRELKNKISRLPRGIIKERRVKDKTYYYLAYRENGKVINKYIGDDSLKAKKFSKLVEERKAFENQLKQLQKDWKIYNKVGIEESSDELRQVITESAKGNDFSLSLRGFLDIFYSYKDDKEKMFALIKQEPKVYKNVPDYQYAMCAATANKLSNDYDLEVPSWVWKDRYYMKEMYFGGIRKGKLRIYNMLYSPAEFKHRGLFVDENILMRV